MDRFTIEKRFIGTWLLAASDSSHLPNSLLFEVVPDDFMDDRLAQVWAAVAEVLSSSWDWNDAGELVRRICTRLHSSPWAPEILVQCIVLGKAGCCSHSAWSLVHGMSRELMR